MHSPKSITDPKHKNMKKTTPRHIIIKLLKASDKERIKNGRGKRHTTEKQKKMTDFFGQKQSKLEDTKV